MRRAPGRSTAVSADERMLRRTSIRLGLQFSGLIVAIVTLVGVVAFTLVSASVVEATDRSLTAAAQDLRGDEAGAGTYVITVRDGRAVSSKPLPAGLPDTDPLARVAAGEEVVDSTVDSRGTTYAVRTTIDRGTVIQVAIDQEESREEIRRLLVSLIVSGIVGALAAGVAGYVLSRRAMRPLVQSLALQRRFVADASHELRTPLTLLSTRVQLLRRSFDRGGESAVATEVAEVEKDTKALTGILEDLLLAADSRDTGLVDVDLEPLVAATAASVAATAAERGVSVETTVEGPSVVVGIEAPLRRILVALLSNALDHARTSVSVRLGGTSRVVTIEVADDGPGFPGDSHPFERFSSDRPEVDGERHYGLGLALVADIVARYGGTVSIVKERPGGNVRVDLPRASR